ncbi:MAG: DUF4268 domain-containing protein [Gemmatimonadota bacterium]|nr:DUF4268 domain-containing protein [Gemmatimonadota bacterium]
MYKIDTASNSIQPLEQKSFSSLGFRERGDLQEWIAKQPSVLGEDLLIIQKEFRGFDETQERLDLLALDKQGALVVIENKLDDSGKDVTWQALKYASYCSRLSKSNIAKIYQKYLNITEPGVNAEERISEFMDDQDFEELILNEGVSQRIIMIAAKFRKEVTSTVLWLMNFGVHLQCFRAALFAIDDEQILHIEQIIPTQDTKDYMIGMAEKARDDIESKAERGNRYIVRESFWYELISEMNLKGTSLFQNISPGTRPIISAGAGISGIIFSFNIKQKVCRAFLDIAQNEKSKNKIIFDRLKESKQQIEDEFGDLLEWDRRDKYKACHIGKTSAGNVFDRDQWKEMIDFMTDAMFRLEQAIKEPLKKAVDQAKNDSPK